MDISRKIAILAVLIVALFLISQLAEGEVDYVFNNIKHLNYGDRQNQIGLFDSPGMPRVGPESFWVNSKGEIYICDTVNSRIKHLSVDGRIIENLPIDFNCNDLSVDKEGNIFVLDKSTGLLHYLTKAGREVKVKSIRRELINKTDLLRFSDNKLTLTTIEKEEYELGERKNGSTSLQNSIDIIGNEGISGSQGTRVKTQKTDFGRGEIRFLNKGVTTERVTLPVRRVASIVFLDQDEEGNFYFQVEQIKQGGTGITLKVFCLDPEGNVDYVIEDIPNNYWVWIAKLLQVNAKGNIFQVLPTKTGVEINAWRRKEY